jgi:hypothetical protein
LREAGGAALGLSVILNALLTLDPPQRRQADRGDFKVLNGYFGCGLNRSSCRAAGASGRDL